MDSKAHLSTSVNPQSYINLKEYTLMITIFHARIVAIEPDIDDVYITATTSKFAHSAAVDYLTKQYNELYPEKDDLLIKHREAYIETFTIDITELPLIDVDLSE
jgi:hypothetical protein